MLKTVAKSYWRSIQRGTRTFDSIPGDAMKDLVRELAREDVNAGLITAEQYEQYIGEAFAA